MHNVHETFNYTTNRNHVCNTSWMYAYHIYRSAQNVGKHVLYIHVYTCIILYVLYAHVHVHVSMPCMFWFTLLKCLHLPVYTCICTCIHMYNVLCMHDWHGTVVLAFLITCDPQITWIIMDVHVGLGNDHSLCSSSCQWSRGLAASCPLCPVQSPLSLEQYDNPRPTDLMTSPV